jgi:uncharacterized protein (DUF2252 family)
MSTSEETGLISGSPSQSQSRHKLLSHPLRLSFWLVGGALVAGVLLLNSAAYRHSKHLRSLTQEEVGVEIGEINVTNKDNDDDNDNSNEHDNNNNTNSNDTNTDTVWTPGTVQKRCDWVMARFAERDAEVSDEDLAARYPAQSVDFNVFYRATAHIFWKDFVDGHWGDGLTFSLRDDAHLKGHVPLDPQSTWTWVTGDQHLSNFGAWRNRHGDVVFGVNDFDEAAIYSFQMDVLRIAVSIFNHGITNDLSKHQVNKALEAFTESYVQTVENYVGNDDALLFELTSKTAKGKLKKFLEKVEEGGSSEKQIDKFTIQDELTGKRQFQKGSVGQADKRTKLAAVAPEREAEIRAAFTSTKYGATMMKLGWAVRKWDDDFFTVLDVAARIGSGIGSFGVDRYYMLLKGTDGLLGSEEGSAVVLDVKYQPEGAVSQVLTADDTAWYDILFANAAARTVEAQRRLTSYTDPYTGWVLLTMNDTSTNGLQQQPFSIRQRSPWKESFELEDLTDPDEFSEFMSQIAEATATSHVRGSVAKKPGDFKSVIQALLGNSKAKRKTWGRAVAVLASAYHEQVLLDFECFQEYVSDKYGKKKKH